MPLTFPAPNKIEMNDARLEDTMTLQTMLCTLLLVFASKCLYIYIYTPLAVQF